MFRIIATFVLANAWNQRSTAAFSSDVALKLVKQSPSKSHGGPLHSLRDDSDTRIESENRRSLLQKATFGSLVATTLTTPFVAAAKNIKSRTTGYQIQHSESDWSKLLSKQQYFILREGGTESPYSSILEGEERPGIYSCAGCQTPLFEAKEKFHSGTGWPSFASPLMSSMDPKISNVEMEDVSTFQYQLAGAEIRCNTCGGHLGDVFADGFLFVGTRAAVTGKRYCIDGGALLFAPEKQNPTEQLEIVRGDLPPKSGTKPVFMG